MLGTGGLISWIKKKKLHLFKFIYLYRFLEVFYLLTCTTCCIRLYQVFLSSYFRHYIKIFAYITVFIMVLLLAVIEFFQCVYMCILINLICNVSYTFLLIYLFIDILLY